jgi:hypothetical protein
MTDLADLITSPAERLTYLMQFFVEDLEQRHREEEQNLDRLFEEQRRRLHRLHAKAKSAYKTLFDELLIKLNHQEDTVIHQWFAFALKTRRLDLLTEVMERAIPAIEEVERHGGRLQVDISKEGHGPSGCMFSDRKNGYFSFCDEFLDGFDDDVAYTVKRDTRSEKERKAQKEAELGAHIARWRAKEREKQVGDMAAMSAALSVAAQGAGASLREVSAEEAAAACADA